MPRITELWAYVIADTEPGDEGVPAMLGPDGMWMPLIGADFARASSLRENAEELARAHGKPIKLIRSLGIETIEVIEP
jgi:hypothetical protein